MGRLFTGRALAALAVGAMMAFTALQAHAGPKDGLTAATKQHLMDAQAIQNRAIDATMFDGKPVAVIFFASW